MPTPNALRRGLTLRGSLTGNYFYSHYCGGTSVYRLVRRNRASLTGIAVGYLYTLGARYARVVVDPSESLTPVRVPLTRVDGRFTRLRPVDSNGLAVTPVRRVTVTRPGYVVVPTLGETGYAPVARYLSRALGALGVRVPAPVYTPNGDDVTSPYLTTLLTALLKALGAYGLTLTRPDGDDSSLTVVARARYVTTVYAGLVHVWRVRRYSRKALTYTVTAYGYANGAGGYTRVTPGTPFTLHATRVATTGATVRGLTYGR